MLDVISLKKIKDVDEKHTLKSATLEKELTDYKNTLAGININQEAKQSASGYGVVSLPKNCANGQVSATLRGATRTNLVKNGNFANGTTGWTAYKGNISALNNECVFTVGELAGSARIERLTKDAIAGRKYYVRGSIYPKYKAVTEFHFGNSVKNFDIANIIEKRWNTLSAVLSPLDDTAFRFYHKTDTNYAIGDTFKYKEILILDLTATFGAGNEPDLATCDKMFATWFDGTKSTVSAVRLKSVGKNLFDKNKAKDIKADGIIISIVNKDGKSCLSWKAINASLGIRILENKFLPNTQYTISGLMASDGDIYIGVKYTDGTSENLSFGTGTTLTQKSRTTAVGKSVAYLTGTWGAGQTIYFDIDSLQIEPSTVATSYEPYISSSLYLNAGQPLRSLMNNTKDEISAGKLTKRINAYTLQASDITELDKSATYIDYVRIPLANITGWDTSVVSTGNLNRATTSDSRFAKEYPPALAYYDINTNTGGHAYGSVQLLLFFPKGTYATLADAQLNLAGTTLTYQLATPVVTDIQTSGSLFGYPSGTVYVEPVLPVAGLYEATGIKVTNSDFPIATLEKISKIDPNTGVETDIPVSGAVIAGDKLSFTHPSLVAGDIVFFTYFHSVESTVGETTIGYYDSRYTIKDSSNGKYYQWKIVSNNGVPSITLVEV